MSNREDIELMAHLLRRAGFGATRDEIEEYVAKGYDATVEELLNPGDSQHIPDDVLRRYHVDIHEADLPDSAGAYWMYRMITTKCPLEEKITLFWHGVFATGTKANPGSLLHQIDVFRRYGLGRLDDLLVQMSRSPSMIMWLDNNDNHDGSINENFGRELLELFSMGIGNYTEQDIKEAARAFTGWTLGNNEYMLLRSQKNSIWPNGGITWHFKYREDDHDDEEKTFLGETGRFNGEDIIDIIARQPATARFIARHLYDNFVADEPLVCQWNYAPPKDPEAIEVLANAYMDSDHDIRSVLRVLFNSDFFKRARFARVKAPVELVVGTLRLSGAVTRPTIDMMDVVGQTGYMGQLVLNPPSVEGWHEGTEWIETGSMVERVNFASRYMSDVEKPGVRAIIDRLASQDSGNFTPEQLIDSCLELMGPITMSEGPRAALVGHVAKQGDLSLRGHQPGDAAENRVGEMLGLIASTQEYQRG